MTLAPLQTGRGGEAFKGNGTISFYGGGHRPLSDQRYCMLS